VIDSSPEEIRLAEEALSLSALAQVKELPTAQRTAVVLAEMHAHLVDLARVEPGGSERSLYDDATSAPLDRLALC
jgi:hypothetical protein